MIFVGKKRVGTKALGANAWVAVGEDHVFAGDFPHLKALCGERITLQFNEIGTLVTPKEHVERAIFMFIGAKETCPGCVRWLVENGEDLIAAEKIGEKEDL